MSVRSVLGTIYSVPICFGFYLTFRVKNKLYLFFSRLCLKLSCSCTFCPFSPLVSIVYYHQYLIVQFLLLSIIALYTEKGGKVFHYTNLDTSQPMSLKIIIFKKKYNCRPFVLKKCFNQILIDSKLLTLVLNRI